VRLFTLIILPLLAAGQSGGPEPVLSLPMSVQTHGLYVEARVNESARLRFQFDTAAGWHVVNWPTAEAAGLAMKEHAAGAQGAGDGRTRAARISGAVLRAGTLEIPFEPAAAILLDPVAERKGIRLDGLIGAPLLKRYVVETDVDAGQWRLYSPEDWRPSSSAHELPVRVDGMGVPHVRLSFTLPGGRVLEGEFKVDSAAGGTNIFFAAPYAREHGLLEELRAAGVPLLEDEVGGVGGTSRLWLARIPEIQLGPWHFARPVVGITEARGGTLAAAGLAGIVGGGLFHRFNAVYDCPRGRIFLRPARSFAGPFEDDMAGIRWLNPAPDWRRFLVRSVRAGSPAQQAGIREGDELIEVDSRAVAEFDRAALTLLLQQPGRRVAMKFRRAGQELSVTLQLERLI
jgi:hypothetical protein